MKTIKSVCLMILMRWFAQQASAQSLNLISNPSVEEVSPSDSNLPNQRSTDVWWNNKATFEYKTEAQDWSKSLYITMKRKKSGDAKRVFAPVTVSPETKYTFTDYYKSNVKTEVTAFYTYEDGSVSYVFLKSLPASTEWKQWSVNFITPKNVKTITIYHLISRNWYLATDNFSLILQWTPPPPPTPLSVSITTPSGGANLAGIVNLTASVGWSNIRGVQYQINWGNIGTETTVFPYALDRDTNTRSDGDYIITATVSDTENNTAISVPITIHVKNTVTPPPPPSTNMIANPSVETPSENNPNMPKHRNQGQWGTNNPIFTYPDDANSWNKGIKIEMQSYTNGGAFYFFDPVQVNGNTTYLFTIHYKSNQTTEIDAAIQMEDGSTQYWYIASLPASDTWKEKTVTITTPANAKAVTLYQLIMSPGYLITDDYALTTLGNLASFNRGIVSLTFDDSVPSHYDPLLGLLQYYELPATLYTISNTVDQTRGMYQTWFQEHIAHGNEIGWHTISHPDLTSLSLTDLDNELKLSKEFLETTLWVPVKSFASPYWLVNTTTLAYIKNYYTSHRGINMWFNTKLNFDPYDILIQHVNRETPVETVKARVDEAYANKSRLVLMYHEIVSGGDIYSTTPANLEAALSYIKNSGISVQTVTQALAEVQSQLP